MTRSDRFARVLRIATVLISAAGYLYSQSLNPSYPTREYIRLGSRVIAIEQPAAPATDRTAVTFTPAGGDQFLKLTTGQPQRWSAAKTVVDASTEWLTILPEQGTTDNDPSNSNLTSSTLTLRAGQNTSQSSRTATVRITADPYEPILIAVT